MDTRRTLEAIETRQKEHSLKTTANAKQLDKIVNLLEDTFERQIHTLGFELRSSLTEHIEVIDERIFFKADRISFKDYKLIFIGIILQFIISLLVKWLWG